MKSEKNFAGLGLVTAISASLCCITPVMALLAGTSGLASTFSWLDPFRPYFIGLTVLVLGFAWYQKLKPQKQVDCGCDPNDLPDGKTGKTPFIQTKKFLGIVTVFAALMLAFPLYAQFFYPASEQEVVISDPSNIQKAEFNIVGMTCSGCEEHVNHEVNKLPGIVETTVSYQNGNAIIAFDQTKTDLEEIEAAIAKTGYSVNDKSEIE